MAVIKAKPTSPGRRGVVSVKRDLYKGKPWKSLVVSKSKNGGRNNNGRITVRHQGGGHKQHYRVIDFREINLIYRQLLKGLSMILIDQLTSHY